MQHWPNPDTLVALTVAAFLFAGLVSCTVIHAQETESAAKSREVLPATIDTGKPQPVRELDEPHQEPSAEELTAAGHPDIETVAEGSSRKDWQFAIAMYGWFASVSGTVVTGGERTDLNVPFEDILKQTEGGFQLYTEARWREWFAAFDGTWATLRVEEDGTLLDLDVKIEQRIFGVYAGREVYRRFLEEVPAEGDPDWRREAAVDLYVGARYFSTEPTVKITPIIGEPLGTSSVDERWDPLIGLSVDYDLTRRWSVSLNGDIGGFGIGNASKFTWQVQGFVGFQLARELSLFAGYRALSFDTIEGEGPGESGTDLLQQGPVIGAGLVF